MIFDALLGSAIGKETGAAKRPAASSPRWCRDAAELGTAGIYRVEEKTDGYLVALGDAGRAIQVGPSAGQQLLQQVEASAPEKPTWSVSLVLLPRTLTFDPFDRLPPPAQAMQVVNGPFASSSPTWGKGNRTIEINGSSAP